MDIILLFLTQILLLLPSCICPAAKHLYVTAAERYVSHASVGQKSTFCLNKQDLSHLNRQDLTLNCPPASRVTHVTLYMEMSVMAKAQIPKVLRGT